MLSKFLILAVLLVAGDMGLYGQVSQFQFAVPFGERVEQLLKDSLGRREYSFTNCTTDFSKAGQGKWQLLPVQLTQQINTSHPFGWNDEGMIPAKGYQVMASAGFSAQWKFLHVQLYPQVVYAANNHFDTLTNAKLNGAQSVGYYIYKGAIDQPEYYGSPNFTKAYWGQSFVSIENSTISLRISTENNWWGPGVLNSLMMSNNAAGFPHISLQTIRPVKTFVGNFEFNLLDGITQNSVNAIPGINYGKGFVNGLIASYQPKWVKGLFVGFTRVFNEFWDDAKKNHDYLPVFGNIFRQNDKVDDLLLNRDQLTSIFARFVMPKAHAELYAEYGRNDASYDLRDLVELPEHSRAYIVGGSKIFQLTHKNEFLHLQAEITQMDEPANDAIFRPESPSWYVHGEVTRGYTQLGKVIGAGIGPGSNCRNISASWTKGDRSIGINLMQIERNNELYRFIFANVDPSIDRKWVDNVLGIYGNFRFGKDKKLQLNWNADYVYSVNYHYSLDNAPPDDLNYKTEYKGDLHLKTTVVYWF